MCHLGRRMLRERLVRDEYKTRTWTGWHYHNGLGLLGWACPQSLQQTWREGPSRYPETVAMITRTRASLMNTAGRCCASITPDGSGVYANVELAKPETGSAAAAMGSGTVVVHERREMTARRHANSGETMTEHGGGITMTGNPSRGGAVHEHTVRSR